MDRERPNSIFYSFRAAVNTREDEARTEPQQRACTTTPRRYATAVASRGPFLRGTFRRVARPSQIRNGPFQLHRYLSWVFI
jgi:hypothetical protein